jgi:hypothetical protein
MHIFFMSSICFMMHDDRHASFGSFIDDDNDNDNNDNDFV